MHDIYGRDLPADYKIATAFNTVPGVRNTTIFGVALAAQVADQPFLIWDAKINYVPLRTPVALELVSSSANDSAAGSGAQLVVVTALDSIFNEVTIPVVPNGTTPVPMYGMYLDVNAAICPRTGAGRVNSGNITIREVGTGIVHGFILSGKGNQRAAKFTVPRGHQFAIHNFYINAGLVSGVTGGALIVPSIYLPDRTLLVALEVTAQTNNSVKNDLPLPFMSLDEGMSIQYSVTQLSSNNTYLSFGATGLLLDKSFR